MQLHKDTKLGRQYHCCNSPSPSLLLDLRSEISINFVAFWRNSQRKIKKKIRRLLSPRQLSQKKDHRSPRACVAAAPKTFSDPLIHCYSMILHFQYIHYLVHFGSSLQGGVHFPDSWKQDEQCWKRGTYRPIGDSVLVTGAEGSNCGDWSTRSCRGILRSCSLLVLRV